MKKLLNSTAARAAAFILAILAMCGFIASAIAIGILYSAGGYSSGAEKARAGTLEGWCISQAENAMAAFVVDRSTKDVTTDSAFAYAIYDGNGDEVYSTLDGRETLLEVKSAATITYVDEYYDYDYDEEPLTSGLEIHYGPNGSGHVWTQKVDDTQTAAEAEADSGTAADEAPEEAVTATADSAKDDTARTGDTPAYAEYDSALRPYSITGYVLADITPDSELYYPLHYFNMAYAMRDELIVIAVAAAALAVLMFVFLMASAGRRAPEGIVTPAWTEKIPFDVFTVVIAVLVVMCVTAGANLALETAPDAVTLTLAAALAVCAMALALWWCMSYAVRLKLHAVIKSCVCYKLLAWLWRGVKKLFGYMAYIFRCIPFVPRAVLIMLGVLLVEFIFIASVGSTSSHLTGWFFERALLAAGVIYVLAAMKRLLVAGREIAAGNAGYRVDLKYLRGPLKEHGENLNSITDGVNKAVNDRMKSERFKTELITNVSHDIKTPLTSIINYVDLLEKEEISSEKAREYIDVLARQSARLKKLIEDLIEASKASTGNLAVHPERCELGVMLAQTVGEYEEKLEKAGLELVINKCEDAVCIMADRQHLWRIFDNLMNNICKYSMPGTRVYLDLKRGASVMQGSLRGRAIVTFRNISQTRLTVSEDELTERFVRGDSSRNTEGSGLGLSIANSLTQLQHGDMKLVVDGDLFKVQLSFDTVD